MGKTKYFILFLLLFLTGCSYKYDLKIDKNGKVSESVDVFESNSLFANEGTSSSQYIKMLLDIYKNDYNYSDYEFNDYYKKDVSGVLVSNNYDDFSSYMKTNKVKKTLFGQIELFEKNNHGFFKAYDYRGELFFTSEESDFKNNSVEFNLTIPFEVIRSNADKVDVENGVYTWIFDDETIDKEVNIEFNLDKIVVKSKILRTIVIAVTSVAMFVGLIGLLIFIRYKRVNRI